MPLNCILQLVLYCFLYFALYGIRWYIYNLHCAQYRVIPPPIKDPQVTSSSLRTEQQPIWASRFLYFISFCSYVFLPPLPVWELGFEILKRMIFYWFLSPPPLWELSNNQSALRVFEIVFTQAFRQKTISPPPFGFSNHTTCKTSCNKSMVEFRS